MRRLSFGLVATLGISACDSSSVSNGTSPTPTATSSTSVDTSGRLTQDETTPAPAGDGGGGGESVPTSADAAATPVQTQPNETSLASVDASVPSITDSGGIDTETPSLPPLPPPCGGLCDDAQLCNLATNECVECLTDLDCDELKECRSNACETIIACEHSGTCPEDLAICHSQIKRCVECEIDDDCPWESRCESRQCVAERVDSCAMGADPCSSGTVVQMKGKQVLDAYGDDFCDIPGFELNFQNGARGNSDLPHNMIVRVAWSEAEFHLFAEVEDPQIATNADINYLWSGDVVELFIAPNAPSLLSGFFNGRTEGVQLLIAPPSNGGARQAARLFWLPSEDNPGSYVQAREEFTADAFATRLTDTGYTVEARLPWSMFGPRTPDMENGSTIALDFGLSTANAQSIGNPDDGREGAVVLYAGTTTNVNTCSGDQVPWCNSTTWCAATLSKDAPVTPEPSDAGSN